MSDGVAMMDVERAVERLRRGWAAGTRPDLAALARSIEAAGDDGLVELLSADIEERLARGLGAGITHYRGVFPDIEARPDLCRAVLAYELVHRDDRDDPAVRERLKSEHPQIADDVDLLVDLYEAVGSDLAGGPLEPTGKYDLLEPLGSGAFGEVWRAWDRELERYVALKLLCVADERGGSAGMGRLLAEAQAAAALDHENVVRVHAAGRFESGRHFIDAQLAGDPAPTPEDPKAVAVALPLDRAVVRDGILTIGPRRAAEIVELVCRGVAAAHARGITHRDLKPSNILLTPSGRVLVTDFGLASSGAPEAGRVVGTPAYMAPEQARGERVTPLSDIYALGAVLRFLLTGRHPFEPSGVRHADARLDVLEQVKVGDPGPLPAGTPPTLAAICRKAMCPEPAGRYLSADQMAADLRAWLDHRPTLARPPRAAGRLGLWWRRHAAAATVGAAAAPLALAGTAWYIVAVSQERSRAVSAEEDAERALDRARVEAAKSAAVRAFLEEMLASADPRHEGQEATVRDLLDAASARAAAQRGGDPEVMAAARAVIGNTYRTLGHYAQAAPHIESALAARRSLLGEDHPDTLQSLEHLALLRHEQGALDEAASILQEVLSRRDRVLGEAHPLTLGSASSLGTVLQDKGDLEGAAALHQRAYQGRRRALGEAHPETIVSETDLAGVLVLQGKAGLAEPLLRDALARQESALGPDHPDTLVTVNDLALALKAQGKAEEAEGFYRRAVEGLARRFGEGHLDTLIAMNNLAGLLRGMSKLDEAAGVYERLIETADRSLGEDHYLPHTARGGYGLCLEKLGRHEEAERMLLASHEGLRRTLGPEHPYSAGIRALIAQFYERRGEPERAGAFRQAPGRSPAPPGGE